MQHNVEACQGLRLFPATELLNKTLAKTLQVFFYAGA